jgi:hypothetical protein
MPTFGRIDATKTSWWQGPSPEVYSPYLKMMVSQNYVGTPSWHRDKARFEAQEKKRKKAEKKKMQKMMGIDGLSVAAPAFVPSGGKLPKGKICLDGICMGMSWLEAKEKIVQKEGEDYWSEWKRRVRWIN